MDYAIASGLGSIGLAAMFFVLGPLDDMVSNHKEIKLRELEVREQEAKARIAESQRSRF
jgi:hypothetical protein